MKTYFRILSYAKPFGKNIPLYLLFTVFYIVFSMINFSVLIPLLEVLFNQIDEQTTLNYTEIGNFQISLDYFKSIFYNNFNKIVESGGRKEALKFVCIIIVASVFFSNLFRYLSAIIIAKIRVKIVTNIRNQLFNKILSFKINFFTNKKKGDVVSRLTSDIQQIENSVINSIRVLFKEPALLLGLFFILSTISVELTLYTIFLIPISGAIISYIAKHLKIKATYSQNALGRINNVISESLDGIRIIKLFTANWFVNKKFKEEVNDYGKQNLSMYKRFELASPISEFLGVATVAGILLIGGSMVLDKSSDISASEFIAFIIIFSQVLNPAKAISDAFNTIQRGLASADRTFEYVDKTIIVEEVNSILAERSYKYGGLLDPEKFDPIDPEIHIVGFGTMARSSLRQEIVTRLEGAYKTAKDAAAGGPNSYDKFKSLEGVLEDKGVLMQQIKAEAEIANELEQLRIKGGRRAIPIPKQL